MDIIETWHSALDDGDIDTANNLIHENASEETGVTEITEGQGEFYNGNSVTLDNTEIVEEDDNVVVVEVTTTVAGNTETSTLELRSQDGAWKVYGIRDE
ncbi:CARF domain containing protein [Halapricum desulfuricans]|uniref:CARF domain containing protein n=1 Tax=Halapricum desulfuricans TaxID=2841257 RepID=A0A897N560_9EURY|nr:CARF domain containing protein [Halapricum desulfuricans]